MQSKVNPNKWVVFTSGPRGGKTDVQRIIDLWGYLVHYETDRTYIDLEIARGKSTEEIRGDEAAYQRKILELNIEIEKRLPREQLIIFDRAIPDSWAYFQIAGISAEDKLLQEALATAWYRKVFLFDLLEGYDPDYAQTETPEERLRVHELLAEAYQRLNIPLVRVPLGSRIERARFVINNL